MSASMAYSARLVPIGEPATVRGEHGEPVTFTFDEFHFSVSRSILRGGGDVPLLVGHDDTLRIGTVRSLEPNRDWWVVGFEVDDEVGVRFDVGQNVSIGLMWFLNDAGNPRLSEVSVVRRGRIPGAEITAVSEREPRREAPVVKPRSAAAGPPIPAAAGSTQPDVIYGGPVLRRPIGRVLGVR